MTGSYNDWLSPKLQELNLIKSIENEINLNRKISVDSELKRLPLDTLLRFTELSSIINTYCEAEERAWLWRQHLDFFKAGDFSFREQQLLSISQLVKGYYFFMLAAECQHETNPFEANQLEFLQKSAEQHCFNAYNSLTIYALCNNILDLALHYAQRATEYHWTPGYLLLYRTCLRVPDIKFRQNALEALLIARNLADHPASLCAQNNAYFGKGLIEGNNRQFTSWDKVVKETVANSKMSVVLTNYIYDKATIVARNLLSKFEQDEPEELEHNSCQSLTC